jgi:putative nucleotidyltransferase with HDIG domain
MLDQSNHRRKTIGVLIDWTVDPFQQMFLEGVMDFAKDSGMSYVIFEGGCLNSPNKYEMQRHLVYSLANEHVVDGLVILSASIGMYSGKDAVRAFLEPYRSVPMISVSMEIEGIPSVLIDNRVGMRELMVHLVEEHAYRRLAFIRGPEGNQDAEERWESINEVLREYQIPLQPRFVFQGDYSAGSGSEAMKYFFSEGLQDIEAVVALNDGMAMGAFTELKRRKIRVPDQIAITGFDNIDVVERLTPALTTVKQPVREQGWTAAKLIGDLLEQKIIPLKTYLPTKLIVRQSCKCVLPLPSFGGGEANNSYQSIGVEFEKTKKQFLDINRIVQDLGELGNGGNSDHPVRNPVNGLLENTIPEVSPSRVGTLDEMSWDPEKVDLDYETFQNLLGELWRNRATGFVGQEEAVKNEDLVFYTLMRLGQKSVQKKLSRIDEFIQESQKLGLIRGLLAFLDIPTQMDILARHMPELGFQSCFLSLYKDDPLENNTKAVCILGIRDLKRMDLGAEGKEFPSNRLVPDDFLSGDRQRLILVEPLKQFGYMIFEIGPKSIHFASFLSDIIGGALQGAMLFGELGHQRDGLNQNLENMRKAMAGFIQTMSSTVEARDPYTAGHQRHVSDLARTLARAMNLPPAQIEGVRMAGIIHDLGKIYVPAEILNRAGILDDIERSMIQKHPKVAYDILKNINFPWPIADIVYQHHERLDGSGYPNKLKADAICLESKILAVADVMEAMSSRRPYREALGVEKALDEIIKHKGTLYDPAVVEVCVDLFRNKGYKFRTTGFLSTSN